MARSPFVITVGKRRRRRKGAATRTGTSARKQAYLEYMASPAWRAYRTAWWQSYDRQFPVRKCYCCGIPQSALKRSLELHHRTYERLGAERWEDLVPVCGPRSVGGNGCHQAITRMWRNRGRTGMTMTLWELTDWRRDQIRRYLNLKKGSASGR
jgi:hypothetical protein